MVLAPARPNRKNVMSRSLFPPWPGPRPGLAPALPNRKNIMSRSLLRVSANSDVSARGHGRKAAGASGEVERLTDDRNCVCRNEVVWPVRWVGGSSGREQGKNKTEPAHDCIGESEP